MKALPSIPGSCAYSLIEVLIAAGVLLTGIAAAAMMANTMYLQQEANGVVTRALNLQEQAATLWQLGLSPGAIANILPEKCVTNTNTGPNQVNLTSATGNLTVANLGTFETNSLRIIFHSATSANGTLVYQTNTVTVVRPSIR